MTQKKDDGGRLLFSAFYEVLLEGKGLRLGRAHGDGKPGRPLLRTMRVLFNGNLLVGKAYTAQLGLKPGEDFRSSWAGARSGSIRWMRRRRGRRAPAPIPGSSSRGAEQAAAAGAWSLWARHRRALFHALPALGPHPVLTSAQSGLPRPHVVHGMDRHPKQRRFIEVVDLHRDGQLLRPHRLQHPLVALPAQGPQ